MKLTHELTSLAIISIADQRSLDRPIWSALTKQHKLLALGNPLAYRYPSDIAPFAAIADETSKSFDALKEIIPPDGHVVLFSLNSMSTPPAFHMETVGEIQQMVAQDFAASPSTAARIMDIPRLQPDISDIHLRHFPAKLPALKPVELCDEDCCRFADSRCRRSSAAKKGSFRSAASIGMSRGRRCE